MAKKQITSKLHITNEMAALDKKDYEYYDSLTDDEKKQFSPFILMKWAACVEGPIDVSKYYAFATNENVNVNMFDLSKHKKLQWLSLCTVSPSLGKFRHGWLGNIASEKKSDIFSRLKERLPYLKDADIDAILKLNKISDLEEWLNAGKEN
jgi:hypothetical protein